MIKKFNEFVNEGMMSKMWRELDGTERRTEEEEVHVDVNIEGVDEHHSFTDNNGVSHKNGYFIRDDGNTKMQLNKLAEIIENIIEVRGEECSLNDIDVSNVKTFKSLFEFSNFNGDISGWDVKSVIDFSFMFFRCPFNKDLSKWDVSSARDLRCMFSGYRDVVDRTNINISGWKFKCVENMSEMFRNTIINEDFHNWNPNKTVGKIVMFKNCENKNPHGIPKWVHD